MAGGGRKGVRGNPTKYTPRRVKIFLAGIASGLSHMAAAKRAGVNHTTISRWKKVHPEFCDAVFQAEAERESSLVAIVEEGAQKDWRAAKFLLECRHEGWGQAKTSQDDRALMDRLKIMEQALAVKLQAMKIQHISMSGEDYDIIEILNEVHGIEEKFDGKGLQIKAREGEPEVSGGEGDGAVPEKEEGKTIH